MQNCIKTTNLLPYRLQSCLFCEWQKGLSFLLCLFPSKFWGPPTPTVPVSLMAALKPLCAGLAHGCTLLMGCLGDVCSFACRMRHPGCRDGCWAEQLKAEFPLMFSSAAAFSSTSDLCTAMWWLCHPNGQGRQKCVSDGRTNTVLIWWRLAHG